MELLRKRKKRVSVHEEEVDIPEGAEIREMIFGMNDGIVSTIALLAGITGAAVSNNIIILAGLIELAAGAVSMGMGTYIAIKSQREFYDSEIEREKYELKHMPEEERQEIYEIYRKKGFKGKLLDQVVEVITSDKKRWLKVMMEEELGLFEERFEDPVRSGFLISIAFVVAGSVPIIPFFIFPSAFDALLAAFTLSAIVVFAAGVFKAKYIRSNPWKSGFEMVAIASIASAAAFYLGSFLSSLL